MPTNKINFEEPTNEIYKDGKVVGITDKLYTLNSTEITFDDVLVKGDLSGVLNYNGKNIQVIQIDTAIGMEVTQNGARGPVWKGVKCKVL
ncbi:hypothetical protein A3H10_03215 [Candidatus Uhrbacteria bacterium RIFCSPLOWO2_12_FULL_46_10]|nr:MAG: hypothetical protein UX68_C0014G0003 [Parcubacteria group bacterium GW2011_GWA2_46_9]OGL76604.1 MAG: hypothetical protein A3E96_00460 [Candidatus Uhrbacteria bacterium RIFCSPHIGHO2_12_FULL_46_13]OGL90766.1 MAG: hypothetical protein A3H10_03215 [Candidatus Uhrbacteria bacterium RIFCSPLOWO2_12_FULL_46_10]